jgi:sodium/bile acid cotransporter 7
LKLPSLRVDPYLIAILIAVALAAMAPVRGQAAEIFAVAIKFAVALLFFLYGARLAREAVIAGLVRWRLHLLTLAVTFGFFPLISPIWGLTPGWLLAPSLVAGMTYLCCLPSTIQSSVALVASARGNVAAALCSASASNMLGVVLTPLLVALLMNAQGVTISAGAIQGVFLQLLAPFIVGQIVHPWLGPTLARFKNPLSYYDRLTIMMIVYGAFSAAIIGGIWRQVTPVQLIALIGLCAALVALVMFASIRAARAFGFAVEDEIVVAFCGTQKGMAAGVPMASLLFPPASVGLILLPVLVYHQLQLIACATMAGRYANRGEPDRSPA